MSDHTGIMRIHKRFLTMWITTRWSGQCASFPAAFVIRWRSNQVMVQSVAQGFEILNSWKVIYSIGIGLLCAVCAWKEGRYIVVSNWCSIWINAQIVFFCPFTSNCLSWICVLTDFVYLYHTGIYLWTKAIY